MNLIFDRPNKGLRARPLDDSPHLADSAKDDKRRYAVQHESSADGRVFVHVAGYPANLGPMVQVLRQKHRALGNIAVGAIAPAEKQNADRRLPSSWANAENSATAVSDMAVRRPRYEQSTDTGLDTEKPSIPQAGNGSFEPAQMRQHGIALLLWLPGKFAHALIELGPLVL